MSTQRRLTDTEVNGVLVNALYSAARSYKRLAAECKAEDSTARLGDAFENQAKDVTALAERFEQAIGVILEME